MIYSLHFERAPNSIYSIIIVVLSDEILANGNFNTFLLNTKMTSTALWHFNRFKYRIKPKAELAFFQHSIKQASKH